MHKAVTSYLIENLPVNSGFYTLGSFVVSHHWTAAVAEKQTLGMDSVFAFPADMRKKVISGDCNKDSFTVVAHVILLGMSASPFTTAMDPFRFSHIPKINGRNTNAIRGSQILIDQRNSRLKGCLTRSPIKQINAEESTLHRG